MTRSLLLIVCLVLAGLVLGGCAKGISQENARARCLTWDPGGADNDFTPTCADQEEVCRTYFPGQVLESMNRSQCMAHCDEVKRAQRKEHLVDGCDMIIRKSWDMCRSYCLSK